MGEGDCRLHSVLGEMELKLNLRLGSRFNSFSPPPHTHTHERAHARAHGLLMLALVTLPLLMVGPKDVEIRTASLDMCLRSSWHTTELKVPKTGKILLQRSLPLAVEAHAGLELNLSKLR